MVKNIFKNNDKKSYEFSLEKYKKNLYTKKRAFQS